MAQRGQDLGGLAPEAILLVHDRASSWDALKPATSSASPECGEASPLPHRAVGSTSLIVLWVASNRPQLKPIKGKWMTSQSTRPEVRQEPSLVSAAAEQGHPNMLVPAPLAPACGSASTDG